MDLPPVMVMVWAALGTPRRSKLKFDADEKDAEAEALTTYWLVPSGSLNGTLQLGGVYTEE